MLKLEYRIRILNRNRSIFLATQSVICDVVAYIATFIFVATGQDRNGLVHAHVGNKIAFGPLIGTTSVCARCTAFSRIEFRQSSRFQRHVRAKCRINARQLNERKGEGAGGLESFGHDLGRWRPRGARVGVK